MLFKKTKIFILQNQIILANSMFSEQTLNASVLYFQKTSVFKVYVFV